MDVRRAILTGSGDALIAYAPDHGLIVLERLLTRSEATAAIRQVIPGVTESELDEWLTPLYPLEQPVAIESRSRARQWGVRLAVAAAFLALCATVQAIAIPDGAVHADASQTTSSVPH